MLGRPPRVWGPSAVGRMLGLLAAATIAVGCDGDGPSSRQTLSGGNVSSGGASGSGGNIGSGGSSSGGSQGTGGSSTGGSNATGGAGTASGGATASGGSGGSNSGGSGGGSGGGGTAAGDGGTSDGAASDSSAGDGSPNDPACVPIDAKAIPQVKNLLCYLYGIYGNKVLSGQQETSWSNPAGDIDYYVKLVNKHPAILGGDYLYPDGTTARAMAYAQAGGITMLRYHMGAPPKSDTYDDSKGMVSSFDDLTKSGTDLNKSLNSKLDYLATELKKLEGASIPVILVPYHEVDKYAWFWWSKGTGPQFVTLWKYTVDYINNVKGVHNVIWTLGFGHDGALSDYNPGKPYLDLGGIDEYEKSGQPFASHYSGTRAVLGQTLPIPLHETGTIPQPSDMFPSTAPWLLWNVWATYENTMAESFTWNTDATVKKAYDDPRTVTRETLPSLN